MFIVRSHQLRYLQSLVVHNYQIRPVLKGA
jgi:hypothetical protein